MSNVLKTSPKRCLSQIRVTLVGRIGPLVREMKFKGFSHFLSRIYDMVHFLYISIILYFYVMAANLLFFSYTTLSKNKGIASSLYFIGKDY